MNSVLSKKEELNNRNIAWIVSLVIHALLFLWFILFPFFTYLDPPPELQAILVQFEINNTDKYQNEGTNQSQESNFKKIVKKEITKSTVTKKTSIKENKTAKDIKKESNRTTSNIKINKKINTSSDREDKANAELEEKQTAEAYNKAKSQFGNLFGKQTTEEESKKGDAKNNPNLEILENLTKGTGKISGGLKNRGVIYIPTFSDNSQKEGKIVLKVCVNNQGKVIHTTYTQKGSTTSDIDLIKIAERNAKKYIFAANNIDEQCGFITIDFKLK